MKKIFLLVSLLLVSFVLSSSVYAVAKKDAGALDLACIQTAVGKRETAVITASNTLATSIKSALESRKTALISAWGITNAKERRAARNLAWSTFKTAQKAARNAHLASVKYAWATWKTDATNCKVDVAGVEPQGLDVSVSAAAATSASTVTQ